MRGITLKCLNTMNQKAYANEHMSDFTYPDFLENEHFDYCEKFGERSCAGVFT